MRKVWRKRYLSSIIIVVALVSGLAFSATDFGRRVDGISFDTLAPLLGSPRDIDGLLVILITENDYSTAATPMALWGTCLVPLLERIESAKPEAIGLDMMLPRFPLVRFVKDHDQSIFKALKQTSKSCRLISGYGIASSGQIREPFVLYQKILGSNGYGFLNLSPDRDGVCRKQILTIPTGKQGKDLYSFSWLLAGINGPPPEHITPDWRNPAQIPALTFGQALEIDPTVFRGKVVLMGVDFEFEDRHPSPASIEDEPGVMFHARVVEALRSDKKLLAPHWSFSLMGPTALIVLLMFILTRKPSQLKVIVTGLAMLAGLAVLIMAGLAGGIVLRPSAAIVGLVVISSARLFQGYFTVKETFGRYVAREVRDEILSGRIPLDGEMKEVTVLFADLRNFTPMVESTPPKDVVKIINGYFEEMAGAIRENGGLVLQYIGDEIEAVFGAPVPVPDHRRLAINAALSMRARLKSVNRNLVQQGYTPLRHGIGIHTGEVLAANIGGQDRMSYSLVGDTVNLASRLQGLNKQFGTEIIISGDTLTGLEGEISVKQLPPTPIKGKSRPVDIFTIL